MDFKDYTKGTGVEYTYNRNGAMTKDLNKGISSITYNSLNLPRTVDIKNKTVEGRNEYTYSASGQKLKVVQRWNPGYSTNPVIGSAINVNALTQSETTDYVGNIIYENDGLKRILVDGGYYQAGNYYFYIRDHLGNNRVVINQYSDIVQSTQYYPFGSSFADEVGTNAQPYKYNGKELDTRNGLNMYDYSARWKADWYFPTVDPLAEKYYSWSPYAYVGNNPVNVIDPTGMDWYKDKDGTYQYDPNINKDSKLLEGQSYIGVTHQVKNSKGVVIENYRKDGSIMFSKESSAYNRMVSNTKKTGNEELSVITDNGVLVLPSWDNKSDRAKYSEYGYDFKGGNLVDPISGKTLNTIATAHTHPSGGDMSGDVGFARNKTPQRPMFALSTGGKQEGNISYIISSGEPKNFRFTNVTSNSPQATVSALISGRLSLKDYSKSIIKAHTQTGKFLLY